MHTPLMAITWQFWARHHRGLALMGLYAVGLAILFALLPAGVLDRKHAVLGSIPFVIGLAYVAAIFSYGFEKNHLESAESGFPAWQFTLPLRTGVMVGWPMLLGMLAVATLGFIWTRFILVPAGWDPPAWAPVFLAVFLAVAQALVWSPFPIPWVRLILTVGVLSGLFMFSPLLEEFHGVSHRVFLIVLGWLVPLAYGVAVLGVGRARHRGGFLFPWPRSAEHSEGRKSTTRGRTFQSPAEAQRWFERQRFGWAFPVLTAGFSILFLFIFWLLDDPGERFRIGLSLLLLPMWTSLFAGSSVGSLNHSGQDRFVLSSFLATRPMTTFAMVMATLQTTIRSALMGWLAILPAGLIWCFQTEFHQMVLAWFRQQVDAGTTLRAIALVLLAFTLPVLLSVRGMAGTMVISFTGRNWVFVGSCFLAVLAVVCALWGVSLVIEEPERLQQVQGALPFWLGGAVAGKLLIAGWASYALWKRNQIGTRPLMLFLGCWLLAVAGLSALVGWLAPEVGVDTPTLVMGVVLMTPLGRFMLAPLALWWNRHR